MRNIVNKVQLIGNLGTDPEVKTFDNDKTMVKLSLATSERYTNKQGEQITDTTWHQLVAWGSTAKFAEKNLNKGQRIAVDGKIANRSYDDKDGNKRYVSEIVVNEFMMLGNKA